MKTNFFAFIAALTLAVGINCGHAASVSVGVFYESLEPYGEWMDTHDYGYIWHPRDVDDSWRPYTVGHWAYTDAGWTWVSEEPFGWATYHYGRWVEIDRVGWSWVPDQEWGPAWVSWRRSDRHVGWAPLPPEARFEARVGIQEWSDSYYDIGPASYTFVSVRDFGAPRLRTVIVEPRQNITIINETRNITRITYVNNIVVNNGPDYQVIVRDSAQPVRRLKLERRTDQDFRPGTDRNRFRDEVSGETLRVTAPQIQFSRDVAPQKVARKLDRVDVNRGWNKAGDAQATERLRAKMASEARPPTDLPPLSRAPRSGRQADGERPTAATPESAARPGTSTTAETPAPGREAKPGAKASTAKSDAEKKTSAENPKSGSTADQARPGSKKEPSTARDDREKDKDRPPTAVQTPTDEPAAGAAARKPESNRPDANAGREKNSKRPEARTTEAPTAPEARPDGEKPKVKGKSQPEKPARVAPESPDGDRPAKDKPPGGRPSAASQDRPENPAQPENGNRKERKNSPPADAEPQRPSPKKEASPDRVKPEAASRSRENRPPSPDAGAGEAPKKGSKAEDKRGEKKEDKKEGEKN